MTEGGYAVRRKGSILVISALLMVAVMFLGSGCSSLRALVQDVPTWVIEKPSNSFTKVFFVAEGVDEGLNEMTARQLAYEQLLAKISAFLGYDVQETYRRELLQTQGIEDLGLLVSNEFQKEKGGVLTLYILAESNRKTISKLVRENLVSIRDEENKINIPESEAEAAYKRQNDFAAFSFYLAAAIEAYTSPLAESNARYSELMEDAISVLEGLNFHIISNDSKNGVFTARVTRGSGIFVPKIQAVPIKAVFPVKNAIGKTRQEELYAKTDTKGIVSFSPSHMTFMGSGVLTMYIDLAKLLEQVGDVTGASDPYLVRVRSLIADKKLDFPFSISSEIAGSVVVASMLDYSKNGTLLQSTTTLESLIDALQHNGIYTNRIDPSGKLNTESAILQFAHENYAGFRSIVVIGSSGVSSVVESGGRFIASVKGSARVYTLKDSSLYAESGEFAANGVGETSDLARTAAFKRFGQIAASLIIGKLL